MSTGTPPDRRQVKRRRAKIKLRYWTQVLDKVAYASDVSAQGMFIETRQVLAPDTRIHIELYLVGDSFFAEGIITHARPGGLGVRLLSLADVLTSKQ